MRRRYATATLIIFFLLLFLFLNSKVTDLGGAGRAAATEPLSYTYAYVQGEEFKSAYHGIINYVPTNVRVIISDTRDTNSQNLNRSK